jgi:hypothetical protein
VEPCGDHARLEVLRPRLLGVRPVGDVVADEPVAVEDEQRVVREQQAAGDVQPAGHLRRRGVGGVDEPDALVGPDAVVGPAAGTVVDVSLLGRVVECLRGGLQDVRFVDTLDLDVRVGGPAVGAGGGTPGAGGRLAGVVLGRHS